MQTYRVTAPTRVFDHEPGTVFDRDIAPEQEKLLLDSGAIIKSRAQTIDAVDRSPATEKKE